MRTASAAMIAFLASKRSHYRADLFTFTFLNGAQPVLRLASTDQDITYSRTTWRGITAPLGAALATRDPAYPSVTRSRWNVKNTLEVPTLDINLISDGTDYQAGLNIKAMAHNGLFDGCAVFYQQARMPTFGDTRLGLIDIFDGLVGPVQVHSTGVRITVKGANVRLMAFMPRNRYQYGCIHALYDEGCTVNRAAHTSSNAVGTNSTATVIYWGSVPANATNFALGTLQITSGVCAGQTRTIQAADNAGAQLAYPLFGTPSPGDIISVSHGCDKTRDGANGCAFFANQQHFRGFRFIPPATMAI